MQIHKYKYKVMRTFSRLARTASQPPLIQVDLRTATSGFFL